MRQRTVRILVNWEYCKEAEAVYSEMADTLNIAVLEPLVSPGQLDGPNMRHFRARIMGGARGGKRYANFEHERLYIKDGRIRLRPKVSANRNNFNFAFCRRKIA